MASAVIHFHILPIIGSAFRALRAGPKILEVFLVNFGSAMLADLGRGAIFQRFTKIITSVGMGVLERLDVSIVGAPRLSRSTSNFLHQLKAPSLVRSDSIDGSTANHSAIVESNEILIRGHGGAQEHANAPTHIKLVPMLLGDKMQNSLPEFDKPLADALAMQIMVSSSAGGLDSIFVQNDSRILDHPFHDRMLAWNSRRQSRF